MRLLPSDPDVETLVGRIAKGDIDLQPDFQRGEVWSASKRQRLIDSILREWHVPPVHVILDEFDQKVSVLDGQQRLAAIRDFCNGAFPIDGSIEPLDSRIYALDGHRFDDMPSDMRRKFLRFSIRLFTIVDYNPSEPGELFYRLNQLSSLTAAEQRNAFFGTTRKQVKELARYVEELGLGGSVFGFSNARMAYDDVLTRALFLLEARTLRQKTTSIVLADRYRREQDFSDDAVLAIFNALEIMSVAQKKSDHGIRLNKATAQSWLIFLASAPRAVSMTSDAKNYLANFMSRFEFSRDGYERDLLKGSEFIRVKNVDRAFAKNTFMRQALHVYDDRATSRVADISSVVLRDMVIWIFFLVYASDTKLLLRINDSSKSQLADIIKYGFSDDNFHIEALADQLRWGASL